MKIHFIGIGGIGVSSLAKYYISKNKKVSGSDLVESEITKDLRNNNVKVSIGKNSAKNIDKDVSLVIYSPAITKDNPEIKKALKENIKTISYPEALGDLTRKYFTIAISGTHGKSTTTIMTASILIDAGLDPTVIVGAKAKQLNNSNFRKGNSKYLLIEADEYKQSFLNYNPNIITITNIDKDHLDFYGNIDNIIKSFKDYGNKIKKGGSIIINGDDSNSLKCFNGFRNISKYSLKSKEAIKISKLLKVPGDHNVYNALAALEISKKLKVKKDIAYKSISNYSGCWRRFDVFKTNYKNIILVSDYAHHPTEIQETLKAARQKYPKKRIISVFQPHQRKRTNLLFDDFVSIFKVAPVDKIIISETYSVAGREEKKDINEKSPKKLSESIGKKSIYKESLEETEKYIKKIAKENDLFLIMGAGNIYDLFINIKKEFLTKKRNKTIID
jgi:UDP-N-acetylmuramate--alanine ligase